MEEDFLSTDTPVLNDTESKSPRSSGNKSNLSNEKASKKEWMTGIPLLLYCFQN